MPQLEKPESFISRPFDRTSWFFVEYRS